MIGILTNYTRDTKKSSLYKHMYGVLYLGMCHQRLTEVVYLVKAALLNYTPLTLQSAHVRMSDVYEEKNPINRKSNMLVGGGEF